MESTNPRKGQTTTSRAMQAVERHMAAIRDKDLDAIMEGYAPDAVLADTDRIGCGHDYIRAVHAATLDAAAALRPSLEVLSEGEVVFVSWRADRPGGPELVGTNTFVVDGGRITVNTGFIATDAATPGRLDEDVAAGASEGPHRIDRVRPSRVPAAASGTAP